MIWEEFGDDRSWVDLIFDGNKGFEFLSGEVEFI